MRVDNENELVNCFSIKQLVGHDIVLIRFVACLVAVLISCQLPHISLEAMKH